MGKGIYQRPNSQYWWIAFSVGGKQVRLSTRIPISDPDSPQKAQSMLIRIEEEKRRAEKGLLTKKTAHKAISAIYEAYHGEELETESTRSFLARWIKRKASEIRSIDEYRNHAKAFIDALGKKADEPLFALTLKDCFDFRDIAQKKNSNGSVNKKIKTLRVAFNDAVKEKLIPENPFLEVPLLKERDKQPKRAFTRQEIDALFSTCTDPEWLSMMIFALYTGQRLSDLVNLTWNSIDLTPGHETITIKTKKTGIIISNPLREADLLVHVRKLAEKPHTLSTPLHPRLYAIRQRSPKGSTLSNQFYEIMVNAGIVSPKGQHTAQKDGRDGRHTISEISFHSFRHTLTTWLKSNDVGLATAKDIIGHESTAISENYTHIDDRTKRNALNSLPKINSILKAIKGT